MHAVRNTYLQFAREYGHVLELLALLAFQLVAECGELVEQMVDDVGLENLHAQRVGQILCVTLDLHIERQNGGVSVCMWCVWNNNVFI